jgi:hypothetical protein
MSFDSLAKEVQDGMDGKNSGIPMGFNRLNNHVSIRKSTYYLIGGYTGSGKTSIVDDAFVLNPMDWLRSNKDSGLDMHIIYFSMERRTNFKLAKWISRKIFLDQGYIIPINRIMGWTSKDKRLTKDEHDIFLMYEDYIKFLEEKVTIISGPQNPMGIKKYVDEYALKNGTMDKTDPYNPIYFPNDPNKIVEIITDHVGLTKLEKDLPTKKQAIDKSSADKMKFRDLYGYSPIDISQFNRDIANPMRLKNGDVEPMLEDFKDTGSTQENSDITFSLFDPFRYKVNDPSGYDLDKLRDSMGRKKYRSLKILKNSYGSDDIRIGLAFQPEVGLFKEMPKLNETTEDIYTSILENDYFLQQ